MLIRNWLLSVIFSLVFQIYCGVLYAQEADWAVRIDNTENLDSKDANNQPEKMLGVPTLYPPNVYEQNEIDPFADGYIIYPNDNKREQIDLSFAKPAQIANHFCIAGVINPGTVKKVFVKLRNNSWVEVYNYVNEKTDRKFHSLKSKFPLETVYGIRIILDHSRINNWNLIKGVGVSKSPDDIKLQPLLYEEGKTFGGRYPVSTGLNTTECSESNPKMSSEGSVFYFTRDCKDKNRQDIFFSEANGNEWQQATNIGTPINNIANNFMVSTQFDPRMIYVGGIYKPNGEFLTDGLSKSTQNNEGKWTVPTPVEIPRIEGKIISNYFVTMDNTAIILVARFEEGNSNKDLYVSLFNKYKNAWDTPISLGDEINSKWDEETPYFCMDGKTLFFSSNGKIGYGGHDIFVSTRLDKSWTKWSKPMNVGPNVNSKVDDLSFSVASSGDFGYFSSSATDVKNSNTDIYQTLLPIPLIQPTLVAFKAKVTNERTKEPVSAKLILTEIGSNEEPFEITDDGAGNFAHTLFTGKNYYVDVEAYEHFKKRDTLNFALKKVKGLVVKKYALTPFLDSGQVSVFNNITFEDRTAKFNQPSFAVLDQIANKLSYQRKSVIQIAGHTDNIGSDTANLYLSITRAKEVAEYLVSKGVRAWRLKTVGYGESVPIAANETEEGRRLNRRIEMIILESDFTKRYVKSSSMKARIKKGQLVNRYKRKHKLMKYESKKKKRFFGF